MEFSSSNMTPTPKHVNAHDDAYDIDDNDDYSFHTYAPLSCFPTPPTSCHTSSPREQAFDFSSDGSVDANLRGPAIYLTNLIPCAASLLTTSTHLAQSILSKADLPVDTVALAACILDSLTPRFAASWRRSLPLTSLDPKSRHIDCVRPEVIIVGALLVAHKFLSDTNTHTSKYQDNISDGRWTCEQINVTEQCILENLGWRIMPLWREELIADAKDDMRRAGMVVSRRRQSATLAQVTTMKAERGISDGTLWTAQGQLTPVESLVVERLAG